MKIIGVITFHRALNYGAVLQAYSLTKTLEKYGDCSLIDYRCESIENVYYKKASLKNFVKMVVKCILFPVSQINLGLRKKKIRKFLGKIRKSEKIYTSGNVAKANSIYDYFVTGSDQVWNPKLTNNDYAYFLDFANKTKIAYACSFGSIKCLNETEDKVLKLIKDFDFVSVREKDAEEYIRNKTNFKKNCLVCDPVFLTKSDEWRQIASNSSLKLKDDYVLFYEVANSSKLLEVAKECAKNNNLKLFIIDSGLKKYKCNEGKVFSSCGPEDFLNLINKAKKVFTTSYHGLAFSLILNKDFSFELSREKENKNSRLLTLCDIFDISKFNINENALDNIPNWEEINERLNQFVFNSKNYLDSIFADE